MNISTRIISTVSLLTYSLLATAGSLNISQTPLYIGGSADANIMFTLDDSGSMQFEIMPQPSPRKVNYLFPLPDNVYGGSMYSKPAPDFEDDNAYNFYFRSSANNAVFYNPDVTYVPWRDYQGQSMGNADPSAAFYNPANPSLGTINLKVRQTVYNTVWFYDKNSVTDNSSFKRDQYRFWPITYYKYNGNSSDSRLDRSKYTLVRITDTTSNEATFTSPNGTTRTREQEIQNFANWFQYYRSRVLTARAGIGRAFATQPDNIRVGFGAINQGEKYIDGVKSQSSVIKGLRKFSGTEREDFFSKLYNHTIPGKGTPLRSAAKSVGQYFERTDNRGPWGETPGADDSTEQLTCRQSYHILMTDGYWDSTDPYAINIGNSDGSNGQTITGPDKKTYQYIAELPYKDDYSNTLADVAMQYWKRDLRPDLDNRVPTNSYDNAFWQHLVTFTVGLGVSGNIDPNIDPSRIEQWSDPDTSVQNTPEKIDDLLHAAINSRGQFFSASDPEIFAQSLTNILKNITDRNASSASVAIDAGSLNTDTQTYQATYNSGDWTGKVLAYSFDNNGKLKEVPTWDASEKIPSPSQRIIFTFDGSTGQPFRLNNLSESQQALLNKDKSDSSQYDDKLLNYIRGDRSNEKTNSGEYRDRPAAQNNSAASATLGDIINSSPILVAKPNADYYDDWGDRGDDQPEDASPYSSFVKANLERKSMLYVGANDGMLHAIQANGTDGGVERFAYVPAEIYPNLSKLAEPAYSHQFYVDATPVAFDAFYDDAWHTVLISGLGAGGQGFFALDVTDPESFSSETEAAKNVLWEFTDKYDSATNIGDPDLGYTMGRASIIRLNNGKWAALFGNGYNNTVDNGNDKSSTNDSISGNGFIYLVDIETGALIRKFDTKTGMAQDPTESGRPNGIATPSAVDINKDGTTDAIYAGDLFGNVWSIDVTGKDASKWDFSYTVGENPTPIFTACSAATCTKTNTLPITTQIIPKKHPTKDGYLLMFGTGKYFEVGDHSRYGQTTQSFFGIWDPRTSVLKTFNKSQLQRQDILQEFTNDNGERYRVSSDYEINWGLNSSTGEKRGYYIDLINLTSNGNNDGERMVNTPIIRDDKIIFTTLIPSDDACKGGGTSWIMEFNYLTGGRLEYSPFDYNGDGVIDANDFVEVEIGTDKDGNPIKVKVPVSGRGFDSIVSTPAISRPAGSSNIEVKIMSNADGGLTVIKEAAPMDAIGRASWIQLNY